MRLVMLLTVLIGLCTFGFPAHAQRTGTAASPLRVLLIPADGGTEDGTRQISFPCSMRLRAPAASISMCRQAKVIRR